LTPERWAQIEELFHRAAECDPTQRAALLDENCRDDLELRQEVESLLSRAAGSGNPVRAAVRSELEDFGFSLIGEVVSHYRILGGLGGGGMGLVYRAEDLKLGRQVALKFLPEESAKDPAALARFEREARAASALEHPNICPIYEFGEHQGQLFLVMQLLEGQTLRELLTSRAGDNKKRDSGSSGRATREERALPLAQVLELGAQIAAGLEAAHKKGIIHRDIKPANIFVTTAGQAKILDFGLAKLSRGNAVEGDSEQIAQDLSEGSSKACPATLATPDPLLSRTGVAMGTAGYMSPEQARGEKLDARTDLFSFGLVLYEMATGYRAFSGDTGPVLHAAILSSKPTPGRELNPRIPSKLEAILNRALEKDRNSRYQSAAEIRADLQSLHRQLQPRSRAIRWLGAVAGVVAVCSAVVIFWLAKRQPTIPPQPKLRQLTVNSFENRVISGAISPDGKYLAYTDVNGMYVKVNETGQTRAVPEPEGLNRKNVQWEIVPTAWFPDSARFLANAHPSAQDQNLWSSQDTSIWMVSVLSEVPRKLRDKAMASSVSPDGSLISIATNKSTAGDRELWVMGPSGEHARKLFDAPEGGSVSGFSWTADSRRVIYAMSDESGLTLLSRDLEGGPVATLLSPFETRRIDHFSSWLHDGWLLYAAKEPGTPLGTNRTPLGSCNYWKMRLDARTGQLIEKPRRLTNGSGFCMNNSSVTADGKRLAFLRQTLHVTSYMAELAAGGARILNLRHFPLSESSDGIVDWTVDSKEVILISDRVGAFGLYKQLLNEDTADPIVTEGYGRNPCVTPDGKWILYLGLGDAGEPLETRPQPILRVPITGGPSRPLFSPRPMSLMTCARFPSELCAIAEPSKDGRELIIAGLDPLKGLGPELTRFALDPNAELWSWYIDLSPDGTRLALTRGSAGPIYILSVHGQPIQEVNVKGWSNHMEFAWAPDGKGLFVVASIPGGHALLYVDLKGNAHRLWESPGAVDETFLKLSPDGRHLAIHTWTTSANMWMAENF
jgi:serine/threonine protein kinase/Tol biopolymer transport system component